MENTGQLQLQFQSGATLKEVGDEFADPTDQPRFRFGIREGWLTFFILMFLLFCRGVCAVQSADWVEESAIDNNSSGWWGPWRGWGVSKIRFNGIPLFLSGLVLGYVMVLWQTWSLTTDEGVFGKTEDLVDRFRIWVTAVQEGGISADPLPFVTIIVTPGLAAKLLLGLVRLQRAGAVACDNTHTAFALSLNLLYLPREFWIWFYLYILAAAPSGDAAALSEEADQLAQGQDAVFQEGRLVLSDGRSCIRLPGDSGYVGAAGGRFFG